MVKLLGEVKVESFLQSIITQFAYEQVEKEAFLYKFKLNDSMCAIGYEKQKKLFSKTYHFTVIIEKAMQNATKEKDEIRYFFHKNRWSSKKNSSLLKTANEQFLLNWSALDIESLKITETDHKRIFKMSVLPGSYTALLFPPLTQGIALHKDEIEAIKILVETMTCILDSSTQN